MLWNFATRPLKRLALFAAVLCINAQDPPAFRSSVNLVLLDVAVFGAHGAPAAGLEQSDFRVLENGSSREITQFANGDAPMSLSVVVDYSASMRPRRGRVILGVETLLRLLHADDEVSLVVFNETSEIVEKPTLVHDIEPMIWRDDLLQRSPTGRTALYDSIGRAFDLLENGRHERKVIIVLSDGEDTSSAETLQNTVRRIQATNELIFCVGLFELGEPGTNAGALRRISETSGGLAMFDKEATTLSVTLSKILTDIRARYILAFRPAEIGAGASEIRKITVEARDPSGQKLKVRSRSEYRVTGSVLSGNN